MAKIDKKALDFVKKVTRLDGWKNIITGLGMKGKDKRTGAFLEWEPMPESEADNFYAASDVARKVNDEVINDAFREGYELTADDMPKQLAADLEDENQRLQIDEKLQEAWRLARQYGGSAIIPMPRDIEQLAKPFVPESIDRFTSLLVLSRWELPRVLLELDVRNPNFGRPQNYRICPRTGATQLNEEVHHSWLVRFDGAYLPRTKFFANGLWHDSILNTCKVPIRDYDAALAALSATLEDFSVGVMKMKDLRRNIAEDRDDLILKRMEIANLTRSVARTIILDAEGEEFVYQNRTLAGVADAVKLVAGRLVVASNMPHTKILGESPSGSNATGNSTTKDWYDHVGSQQENFLDHRLIKLWKAILSVKKSPTSGKVPAGFKAIYAPLWQEPESVQADMRLKQAQADKIYVQDIGAVTPEEIALSRFGSGEYSTETKLMEDRSGNSEKTADDKRKPEKKKEDPEDGDGLGGARVSAGKGSQPKPAKPIPEATQQIEKKWAGVTGGEVKGRGSSDVKDLEKNPPKKK